MTRNPTYHSIGDHTESLQIRYDPEMIDYGYILETFQKSHIITDRSFSRQYRSAIFYHDETQRRIAQKMLERVEKDTRKRVYTQIEALKIFYPAEDYHQKYALRRHPEIIRLLVNHYKNEKEFMESTIAARLNGYLGGHGNLGIVREEILKLDIEDDKKTKLIGLLEKVIR